MELELTTLLLTAVLCAIIAYFLTLDKARRLVSHIPGPFSLPILGNAFQLAGDGEQFFKVLLNLSKKYGGVYTLFFGPLASVVLSSPDGMEKILRSTKSLSKLEYTYSTVHPWLKRGLLTSSGDKWKTRRRLLTPTFHFRILNDFIHVFNDQAHVMITKLKDVCGKEVDIFPYITNCALDIICEAAMGKKVNAQESEGESTYVKAVYRMSQIITHRIRSPWLHPDFLFKLSTSGKEHDESLKILHGFTRKVIQERDEEMKNSPDKFKFSELTDDDDIAMRPNKGRRLAFLDLLLSMSHDAHLTHDDIQEEVDTFMFEGHDTTAAAMTWTIYFIGTNPEVQRQLHEEVDGIFGDSDRPITPNDIHELKYLEKVIKESLRIMPSVPGFARMLDEDIEVDGYKIYKGTGLSVFPGGLHRDPKIYPDPLRFDPERFSKDEIAKRHPYSYVPFSAGSRNCIGQRFAVNEEKVLLASIMRNFHVEATQKWEELRPDMALILRPADGIRVKLTKRE